MGRLEEQQGSHIVQCLCCCLRALDGPSHAGGEPRQRGAGGSAAAPDPQPGMEGAETSQECTSQQPATGKLWLRAGAPRSPVVKVWEQVWDVPAWL